MTTETKHSPLPWKVYTAKNNDTKILGIGKEDTGEPVVAFNGTMWGEDAEAKANADFIAKACNNHYALVKALSNTVAYIEICQPDLSSKSVFINIAKDLLESLGVE